ncbi:MAG: hypothetical protein OEZ51_13670 [Nitrospinota bacterium]|nr:hypothetical protein [Nitrospinota bacterium]
MLRKILMVFVCGVGLLTAAESQALDKRPAWQVLDEALTYLHGIPEVAWVKFEGHNVLVGWHSPPRNFARINHVAAKRAAHALHNEVVVYSLRAEQTSYKNGEEESYLCKTNANPHEIIESNCR